MARALAGLESVKLPKMCFTGGGGIVHSPLTALRFLPDAAYVDIELRSARTFEAILQEARAKNLRTIVSFHDFQETPSRSRLVIPLL